MFVHAWWKMWFVDSLFGATLSEYSTRASTRVSTMYYSDVLTAVDVFSIKQVLCGSVSQTGFRHPRSEISGIDMEHVVGSFV